MRRWSLSGFPSWLESLTVQHPAAVDRVLGEELTLSLQEVGDGSAYSMFLQNISHAPPILAALFAPRIRAWLTAGAQVDVTPKNQKPGRTFGKQSKSSFKSGTDDDRRFIQTTATRRLADGLTASFAKTWLAALLNLSPATGVETLEKGLEKPAASKTGVGVQLFATLFDRNYGGIGVNLRASGFSPPLLLQLLRLAYRHVRRKDDVHHEGSYSPDTRDRAEQGRNEVLSALLATRGPESWAVKLEMAADPLFEHMRDRVIALADQRAAEEADNLDTYRGPICNSGQDRGITAHHARRHVCAHAQPARRYQ